MGEKWEREIQELLERMDDRPRERNSWDRVRGNLKRKTPKYNRGGGGPSTPLPIGTVLLIAGVALVIAGAFVHTLFAADPLLVGLARWIAIAGVVLFFSPILVARRPSQGPKKWRGKIIEVRPRSRFYHYWWSIRRIFRRNKNPW